MVRELFRMEDGLGVVVAVVGLGETFDDLRFPSEFGVIQHR